MAVSSRATRRSPVRGAPPKVRLTQPFPARQHLPEKDPYLCDQQSQVLTNMQTSSVADELSVKQVEVQKQAPPNPPIGIEIGLLTGCKDRPYAFGLAMALAAKGVSL